MIARSLFAATLVVALSSPAFAFYCPADMGAIDAALGKISLSASQTAEVKKLRSQGEAQHNAGNHTESVASLAMAMRIILNGM